jgi:hypothetical protein
VGDDLPDHLRVLDAGNYPHRSTAGRTGLDVEAEDSFQSLRQNDASSSVMCEASTYRNDRSFYVSRRSGVPIQGLQRVGSRQLADPKRRAG